MGTTIVKSVCKERSGKGHEARVYANARGQRQIIELHGNKKPPRRLNDGAVFCCLVSMVVRDWAQTREGRRKL